MSKLTLKTEGDTHVVVTRRFAASPEAVYRAHVEPELIRKWMLGPDGWTMPVCINEARPGGAIRYEWSNGQGAGFHLTGEYVALEPIAADRLVVRYRNTFIRELDLQTGRSTAVEFYPYTELFEEASELTSGINPAEAARREGPPLPERCS